MSNEQNKLLFEIANWRIKRFYNDMNDHWNWKDQDFNYECNKQIEELEGRYKKLYGNLPLWKNIDDAFAFVAEFKGV